MKTTKPSTTRGKVRVAANKTPAQKPLVRSRAAGEQEIAKLRRGMERLESEPTPGDDDARSSLI